MFKNIIAGECKTCGHTAYWCLCGEYQMVSVEWPKSLSAEEIARAFDIVAVERAIEIGSREMSSDDRDRLIPLTVRARYRVADGDPRIAKLSGYQISQRIYERPSEFAAELRAEAAA